MKYLVLCIFLTLLKEGDFFSNIKPLLIGGQDVNISDTPYMLSLRRANIHIGGAALIGPTWAITSARLVMGANPSQITFLGGTNSRTNANGDGIIRIALEIFIHPGFTVNLANDIAVCRLDNPMNSTIIQTIPVAIQGIIAQDVNGIMSGWGIQSGQDISFPDALQRIELPIMTTELCATIYMGSFNVTNEMICTGGFLFDTCEGDFGGPLIAHNFDINRIVGILSVNMGCGNPNQPSVYTSISAPIIRNFIRQVSGL